METTNPLGRLDFGEDTADLLRVIQESFGIEFTAHDLMEARTIGELAGCISRKQTAPVSERCLTAVVFYQLRRAFIALFNTPRLTIKPETSLRELMPWASRRARWRRVQEHLELVLPPLSYTARLVCLALVISVAIIAPVAPNWIRFTSGPGFVPGVLIVPGALGAILIWALVLRLLAPLARAFPGGCQTYGDLVRLTLARNHAAIASQRGGSSEKEILLALRQLIAGGTGLDVRKITPETLFPEGLNIY